MKKIYTVNAKADGDTLGVLDTDGTLDSCVEYIKSAGYSADEVEICEWDNDICTDVITEW